MSLLTVLFLFGGYIAIAIIISQTADSFDGRDSIILGILWPLYFPMMLFVLIVGAVWDNFVCLKKRLINRSKR